MKKRMIESINDQNLSSYFQPPPHPQPLKKKTVKLEPEKDYDYRQKVTKPKERLVESVVDMAKQIEEEIYHEPELDYLSARLRFKEPSFIAKTRKYR